MKFDTIIIGGGLSGLVCGITLAEKGKRTAVISAGQSCLHYFSGSFDLLGYDAKENVVVNPLDAIKSIDSAHPYYKIGEEKIKTFSSDFVRLLGDASVKVKGNVEKNHFRFTPIGMQKPTWLTLDEYVTSEIDGVLPWKKVVLVNVNGFFDFPAEYFATGLKSCGAECTVKILEMSGLKERRQSPSEMRATNIAKILFNENAIEELAKNLNNISEGFDAILFPSVLGLDSSNEVAALRAQMKKPLYVVATLPPSVPGVRVQTLLRKHFVKLGGMFFSGDMVMDGVWNCDVLKNVHTSNLPDEDLEAENFVLASGSFKSRGILSDYNKVYEPIFHLDVDAIKERTEWYDTNVFNAQPYMKFGVSTDKMFHALRGGKMIKNLYAAGSVLSGHNTVKQGDGTGVSIMTALAVANTILNK